MRISFFKIASVDTKFGIDYEDVSFSGIFKKEKDQVKIDGTIKGGVEIICNRCGCEFSYKIDEDLLLWVNDGCYNGDKLDVIESHDHFVDFEKILLSEIESIKSDYHYCNKCIKD